MKSKELIESELNYLRSEYQKSRIAMNDSDVFSQEFISARHYCSSIMSRAHSIVWVLGMLDDGPLAMHTVLMQEVRI